MKVIKATQAEQDAYLQTAPVYPLYGFIVVSGLRCPIEDLRGQWRAPDPIYEVLAPDGYHWGSGEWTHSLLCHSLRDVVERARAGLDVGEPA